MATIEDRRKLIKDRLPNFRELNTCDNCGHLDPEDWDPHCMLVERIYVGRTAVCDAWIAQFNSMEETMAALDSLGELKEAVENQVSDKDLIIKVQKLVGKEDKE